VFHNPIKASPEKAKPSHPIMSDKPVADLRSMEAKTKRIPKPKNSFDFFLKNTMYVCPLNCKPQEYSPNQKPKGSRKQQQTIPGFPKKAQT
jgi:hypothetical protein